MKKLLAVLAVVAVGFAFTSCKKDCKCTTTVAGMTTETTVTKEAMDAAGIDKCSDMNSSAEVMGIKTEVSCK